MIDLQDLQEELEARLLTVWPELLAGAGIFDVSQVMQMTQERMRDELGAAAPYAVIEYGEPDPSDELIQECYLVPVMVHYVMKTANDTKGGQVTLRTKLLALAASLHTTDLSYADVRQIGPIDTTPGNPMNDVFLTKELPFVAGTLNFQAFVGA